MGIEDITSGEIMKNVNNMDYWLARARNFRFDDPKYKVKDDVNFEYDDFVFKKNYDDLEDVSSISAPEFPIPIKTDVSGLEKHLSNIKAIMDNHYLFGRNKIKYFPDFQCSVSSSNIALSATKLGYENVLGVRNELPGEIEYFHSYNAFLFDVEGEKLVLWADPTSNQLVDKKDVKNLLFLTDLNEHYKVAFRGHDDLVPTAYRMIDDIKDGSLFRIDNQKELFEEIFEESKEFNGKWIVEKK